MNILIDHDPSAYRVDAKLGKSPITLGYQRVETGSVSTESTLDWAKGKQGFPLDNTEGVKGWDITYSKDDAKNTTFTLK